MFIIPRTVVIELRDERYDELIVEVADPLSVAERVRAALPDGKS